MAKVAPTSNEQILDASTLPKIDDLPPTKELPKPLANFKEYVDSKWCYFGKPVEQADLIDIQAKVAFQCHMKILVEDRHITWTEKPCPWGNETFLGSHTLGRLVESTTRNMGPGMGHIWDDYEFPIPQGDKKVKQSRNLPEGNYVTRCTSCRGKCIVDCDYYQCKGTGIIEYFL